ncbi:MAG TPA: aldo/keto reductase [Tepidisphaeraceae bacterium]|jgi:predicted aldo/keto reductase-like oxidoreductase
MERSRRDVLKVAAAVTGITTAMASGLSNVLAAEEGPATRGSPPETTRKGDMIYRPLGKTGVTVSAIGLGGHHMGEPKDEQESIRIVRTAVDRGITFLDNSWDYHNGGSEIRMGKALRDGYRDKVFLMTKINGRDKKKAAEELNQCLQRLQTDHLDLIQHHAIEPHDDPEKIMGEDGAHAALLEAQKAGKVRFIGFTGHKDPAAHLKMIETAKKHGYHFDTVQMPLNVMDAHFRSFEKQVLPVLVKEQIGVLGMKSLGMGSILKSGKVNAIECIHYALNLPTNVVICGIDKIELIDQAFEAARTFKPMSEDQVAALLDRTRDAAAQGKFEPFKTSDHYHRSDDYKDWEG